MCYFVLHYASALLQVPAEVRRQVSHQLHSSEAIARSAVRTFTQAQQQQRREGETLAGLTREQHSAEKLPPERLLDKQYPQHDDNSGNAEDRKQGGMVSGFQGGDAEVAERGRCPCDTISGILHGLSDGSLNSAVSTRAPSSIISSTPERFATDLMGRVTAGAISVLEVEKALCEALEDTSVNDGIAGASLDPLPSDGGGGGRQQAKADRRLVLARCAMAFFREYVTAASGFQGGRSPVNALRRPSQGNGSPETSVIAGEAGISGLPPGWETDNPSGSETGYPSVQPVMHHAASVWATEYEALEVKTSSPPTPLLLPPLAALPSRLLNFARDTADYALMRDLRVVLQQATLAPVGLGR